jgi:hypothetical protein
MCPLYQPSRISSAAEKIMPVYASDTIEDPCGGNIISAAEISQAILVNCA